MQSNKTRAVICQDVNYFESARGLLARPKRKGNYPGVVIIHEWWGLNDVMKNLARDLAAHGYVVLAVDLYHGQVTADPERASRLAGRVDQSEANKNMRAAADYLRVQENVSKIAVIGEKETRDAWENTLKFLKRNLKAVHRKVKVKVIE